jgi:mercuric ion binding protein
MFIAMKKMQIGLFTLLMVLAFSANAQTGGMVKKSASSKAAPAVTETFMVLGNCGMCERTIEKAALEAGATAADWDMDKDLITIKFDAAKTSVDAIQKAIAKSGYDNAGYKAPDEVYENLHHCCKYDRTGRPGTAKACEN